MANNNSLLYGLTAVFFAFIFGFIVMKLLGGLMPKKINSKKLKEYLLVYVDESTSFWKQ